MGRKIKPLAAKYGKLKVIGIDHTEKNKVYVRCVCDCGTEKLFLKSNLMSGKSTSCGCQRGKRKPKNVAPAVEVEPVVKVVEPQLTLDNLVVELKERTEPKKNLPKVTEENYFSTEINMAYLDCTTYKNFVGTPGIKPCEARALAEAKGEIEHPVSVPLMVGSYVDAYFSGKLDKFKSEHPEIFSTRGATAGELKSDYKQADVMIQRAIKEPLFIDRKICAPHSPTASIIPKNIRIFMPVSYFIMG